MNSNLTDVEESVDGLNGKLNNLGTMIDYGQFTITGNGEVMRQEFSFNKTFPKTPKIFFTIQRNSSTYLLEADIALISLNTTACYFAFKSTNGLSHTIHWLAIC